MKNLTRNIRWWLIHKLGGYTIQDMVQAQNDGRKAAVYQIKQHADSLYGSNLSDWCNDLYHYICNMYLSNNSSQTYEM